MGDRTTWCVDASVPVELFPPSKDAGTGWLTGILKPVPAAIAAELGNAIPGVDANDPLNWAFELRIGFRSVGESDSGNITGPAERCYPPELEDERNVTEVTVLLNGREVAWLSKHLFDDVFDTWERDILDAEIEIDDIQTTI